jgi:photosystem II stability/assembly factor-like uncharacterized protein
MNHHNLIDMKKLFLIAYLAILSACFANAQWEPVKVPLLQTGWAYLHTYNNDVYASSGYGGLYLLSDGQNTWKLLGLGDYIIPTLFVNSEFILAGGYNVLGEPAIFISTNKGDDWQDMSLGLPTPTMYEMDLNAVIAVDDVFFAATSDGVYKYWPDTGEWQPTSLKDKLIIQLVEKNNTLIALSFPAPRIQISDDLGMTWNNSTTEIEVFRILPGSTKLFALTDTGVAVSEDLGNTWSFSGLDIPDDLYMSAAIYQSNIYLLNQNGLMYHSPDEGENWSSFQIDWEYLDYFPSIAFTEDNLLISSYEVGTFFTDRNSIDWKPTFFISELTHDFVIHGSSIWLLTDHGLYLSDNEGEYWELKGFSNGGVGQLAVSDQGVFATDQEGSVFISEDRGIHWELKNQGLGDAMVNLLFSDESLVLAATHSNNPNIHSEMFKWNSISASWESLGLTNVAIWDIAFDHGKIYMVSNNNTLLISDDNGATWSETDIGPYPNTINSVSASGNLILCGSNNGVWVSTDAGENWDLRLDYLTEQYVNSTAIFNTTLFAATDNGVFYSEDKGLSWQPFNEGLPFSFIENKLVLSDGYIYVSHYSCGVWKSAIPGNSGLEIIPYHFTFQVYPNPVKDKLFIETKNQSMSYGITVRSVAGIELFTKEGFGSTELSLEGLTPGIYLLELGLGNDRQIVRILKL